MGRPARDIERIRLNLEFPADVRDRLEALRDQVGAESLTEVIRRAVAVYAMLVHEQNGGGHPVVRYENGDEREIMLEFFAESKRPPTRRTTR